MMHRCIEIFHIPRDQRIVAAHFQRQHLARLAGELAVQDRAHLVAAGKQNAVELRMLRQRFAGGATAVDQIQHAVGQARALP